MPVSSAALFVVSLKKPGMRQRIPPLEFLSAAPYPACLGFPLEAPLKFIFMKSVGGGVQMVGLLCWCLGFFFIG